MGKLKDRTGERRLMNCGEYATVIAYRHSYDIDVRFDDGTVVFNKNYYSFQSGGTYYICQCRVCSYKDILNPQEILKHKCKEVF